MLNLQIVSDLHIEYKNDDPNYPDPLDLIKPVSEILVLAGDIGSLYKIKQLQNFLKKICIYYKYVLYIPGNHEYYTVNGIKPLSFQELNMRLYNLQSQIDNIYILNRGNFIINDICIVGCTLWSNVQIQIPKYIVRINGISNDEYLQMYNDDLLHINNTIDYCKNNNLQMVVVSHHCPTYSVLGQNYHKKEKYLSLYVSNLDHLLDKNNIHTWVCGHIHKNFDFITENGTRIVGNQKGKPKDRIHDFLRDYVIQV